MQVFQTAGVPPSSGSTILAIIGCTRNSSVELRNSVQTNSATMPSCLSASGMPGFAEGGGGFAQGAGGFADGADSVQSVMVRFQLRYGKYNVDVSAHLNTLGQPVGEPVPGWTPPPRPSSAIDPRLAGRFCRLEPL